MTIGGAEKLVYDIISFSKQDDLDIFVCCLDSIGELGELLKDKGIPVFLLNRKPGKDLSLPFKIARICRTKKIDLLHAHQYAPFIYSALSRFLYHPPKLIFTEHGRSFPDIDKFSHRIVNKILNLVTDRITVVSESCKKSLVRYEGFFPGKIQILPNGIDLRKFSEVKADKSEIKHNLGISKNSLVIGCVGRVEHPKNPLFLIKIFSLVSSKISNVRLLMVGDGKQLQECKDLAAELKIIDKVQFLGMRRDIPELMKIFDIFVLASLTEAMPLALLEAMTSGVPAVCTNVGDIAEFVIENKTGLLSPRDDINEFSNNLIRLLRDNETRRNMSEAAKKMAFERFDIKNMLNEYFKKYKELSKIL